MSDTVTKTVRRKRCWHCDELKDDVLDGLCADCKSYYFVCCTVCKEHIDRDDGTHRHLFWTDCGFGGAGSNETDAEDYKADVLAFLDLLPLAAVQVIRSGIAAERFSLQYCCSMLGGYAHIWCRGVPPEFSELHQLFDQREITDGQRTGLLWLFTLYKGDTADANKLTLGWIDEWLARRERHETLCAFRECLPSPARPEQGEPHA